MPNFAKCVANKAVLSYNVCTETVYSTGKRIGDIMHGEEELLYLNKWFMKIFMPFTGFIAFAYAIYYAVSDNPYKEVFVVVAVIIALFSIISGLITYRKNRASDKLYRQCGWTFMLYYTAILLYTNNPAVFSYILPVLLMLIMYQDYKYLRRLGTAVIIINLVDMVSEFAIKHTNKDTPIDSFIIQFLVTIISVIIFQLATKALVHINQGKIDAITESREQLKSSVHEIDEQLTRLNKSSEHMRTTMEEVDNGIGATAMAVQNQMEQTTQIQDHITAIEEAANGILTNMQATTDQVQAGATEMEGLVAGSEESVSAGALLIKRLDELKASMDEMNSITDLISGIAFQSSLMALNARVEASRAGEAGKGFGVVATEMSGMSGKTKEATEVITNKIEDAKTSLAELVDAVTEMIKRINSEKQNTDRTATILETIRTNTEEVHTSVKSLLADISTLSAANEGIVSSIQTISATSEEVTALAREALNVEIGNADSIAQISKTVSAL